MERKYLHAIRAEQRRAWKEWRSFLSGPNGPNLWRSYEVRISSGLICGKLNGGRDRDRTGDPCLQSKCGNTMWLYRLAFTYVMKRSFAWCLAVVVPILFPFSDCTARMRQFSMGTVSVPPSTSQNPVSGQLPSRGQRGAVSGDRKQTTYAFVSWRVADNSAGKWP